MGGDGRGRGALGAVTPWWAVAGGGGLAYAVYTATCRDARGRKPAGRDEQQLGARRRAAKRMVERHQL